MLLLLITPWPLTVEELMLRLQLVERRQIQIVAPDRIMITYGSDALSQELEFWLAMAQGSRLISSVDSPEGRI
jgi:hypothetical protein